MSEPKKKIATKRTGNTYVVTSKGTKTLTEAGGQQAVVFNAMKSGMFTAAEITKKVENKLTTKQDAGLVVGFYLTNWKADGLVKFGPKRK